MAMMLFSGVMMLAVLSMRGLPASPGGGGIQQFPSRNGDVNCDGMVDLSDGIQALSAQFVSTSLQRSYDSQFLLHYLYAVALQVRRASPTKPPSRAARMLALAYYIERQVEAGNIQSHAAAARALGMSLDRQGLHQSRIVSA